MEISEDVIENLVNEIIGEIRNVRERIKESKRVENIKWGGGKK